MTVSTNLWTIEVMGTLRARQGDRVVTHFRTHKTAALLGLIATHNSRPHRREELIEILWPGEQTEPGRNRLRLALSALRRDLDMSEAERVIVADRTHVQLNPETHLTDKASFESLVEAARRAPSEEARVPLLVRATDLYRGDLLPGFDEAWIQGERQRLQDTYLLALRRLVKALARTRQYEQAISYARRAIDTDPLREDSHRLLIQLYLALGRPGLAQRQHQTLERLLEEELGIAPALSLQQLRSRMEAQSDSGVGNTPASPPAQPHRHTSVVLPNPATPLFGREADVSRLAEMLTSAEVRLLTLTGLGGSGKTRLALALAHKVQSAFTGRTWFVPIAAKSSEQCDQALADALRMEGTDEALRLEQARAELADAPALLVLDTGEETNDAIREWVQALLDQMPHLICLVTARQRLGLRSEYEQVVSLLPVPLLTDPISRLKTCPSVQLFLDRARAGGFGLILTPSNARDIARLCRELDGIPLALELAAAWTRVYSPAQLIPRLSARFNLLTSRNHDVPHRHRSLHAVLTGSVALLEPETQAVFARLSVFHGGWTLEAVEAVCPEPELPIALMSLQEHALITRQETTQGPRFAWPDTVRTFAREQLSEEVYACLVALHAAFYQSLVQQQAVNLVCLDTERANWQVALAWRLAHPPGALEMAVKLYRYWYTRGYLHDGQMALLRAVEAEPNPSDRMRLNGLGCAGNLASRRGDMDAAHSCFTKCLHIARAQEDKTLIAAALCSLGNVAEEQGDLVQARTLQEEGVTLMRQGGAARPLAVALVNLANLLEAEGKWAQADTLLEECIVLFRAQEEWIKLSMALCALARVRLTGMRWVEAASLLHESLTLCMETQTPWGLSLCLEQIARLCVRQAHPARATQLLAWIEQFQKEEPVSLPARLQQEQAALRAYLQEQMGAQAYAAAWEEGRQLEQQPLLADVAVWTQSLSPPP